MNPKKIGGFVGAILVMAMSLTAVSHFPILPPVSDGGELAYVRDFDADGAASNISDDQRVSGLYVAFGLTTQTGDTDDVEMFDSRGRLSDTEVFHRIQLEDTMLEADNRCFWDVSQYTKGAMVADSDIGTVTLFNGVNAAVGLQANHTTEATFHLGGGLDVQVVDDQRIEMHRHGHVYVLEIVSGQATLTYDPGTVDADAGSEGEVHGDVTEDTAAKGEASVEGEKVHAELEPGADFRGWLKEYPATTNVTNHHLDHIAATGSPCGM